MSLFDPIDYDAAARTSRAARAAGARAGAVARDEAVARVDAHANMAWSAECMRIIRLLACTREVFDTDDVWEMLDETGLRTHNNKAMGARMQDAARRGWIVSTELPRRRSTRPECHRRDLRQWRSLIVGCEP